MYNIILCISVMHLLIYIFRNRKTHRVVEFDRKNLTDSQSSVTGKFTCFYLCGTLLS